MQSVSFPTGSRVAFRRFIEASIVRNEERAYVDLLQTLYEVRHAGSKFDKVETRGQARYCIRKIRKCRKLIRRGAQ